MAAGFESVRQWLAGGTGFEQLGMVDEPLVDGRMTFAPNGQTGLSTVAVRAGDGAAAAWLDSWQAFTPPMDAAVASPGIEAAVVVDDSGRVVVPMPELIDGQPLTGRARAFDDGTVLVEPQAVTAAYEQVRGLRSGASAGVTASRAPTGGRARGAPGTQWVSVPIPRLDGSVAVAWDLRTAEGEARSVVASVARSLAVLAAVAVVALGALWLAAGRPVAILASRVRAAEGGPVVGRVGGAREVRELRSQYDRYSHNWVHIAEVAGAARERERVRMSRLLDDAVAQRLATGTLLVREDPDGAEAELHEAAVRLGEITSSDGPGTVVGGGLGAALAVYTTGAGDWVDLEDLSGGARADAEVERLVYRSVLEVLAGVQAQNGSAHVRVQGDDGRLRVRVRVTGGGWCPGVDDSGYWQDHELTAVGGSVVQVPGIRSVELSTRSR